MELKKLKVHLKPDEVNKFKSVLKVLKYAQSGIMIENLVFNNLPDSVEVSFDASIDSYNSIIEKLALNSITLDIKDEETKKIIDEANQQLERSKNKNAFLGWRGGDSEKKKATIEHLVENGNYEDLIRISRDVRAKKDEASKANSFIDSAINNAIDKAYEPAMQDSYFVEQGLKRLLQVAGDRNLNLIKKNEIRIKAGILAINVCVRYKEHYDKLITICNNSKLESVVNITAAVKLGHIFEENSYSDKKLLDKVVKGLNVKWLLSPFEVVKTKFDEKEIREFKKLIDFVEESRGN